MLTLHFQRTRNAQVTKQVLVSVVMLVLFLQRLTIQIHTSHYALPASVLPTQLQL